MTHVKVYNFQQYQSYGKIFQLQHTLVALRANNQIDDLLLLLEHTPVITVGRTPGAADHLLSDSSVLNSQGIDVCSTNRGGDVTYHGPGQLVAYFIISLIERDIHSFVDLLEQSIITLLAQYGVSAHSDPKYPGVWVKDEKICALGIAVKKWVTMHGIALNIYPDLEHFRLIVPCGIPDRGVTSLRKIYQHQPSPLELDMELIKQAYIQVFSQTFHVDVCEDHPQNILKYCEPFTHPCPSQEGNWSSSATQDLKNPYL